MQDSVSLEELLTFAEVMAEKHPSKLVDLNSEHM